MTARVLLCFGLLMLFPARGEAQTTSAAWHPLPSAFQKNRYDYTLGNETIPDYPLAVDSITVAGGDSLWWTRLYPFPCDTCDLGPTLCAPRYYPGLPLFLGQRLRKTATGVFRLEGWTNTLTIETKGNPGASWTFSDASSTTAVVDAAFDSLLWESTLDSVKRILVCASPGQDTVLLSKRHGILRYPSAFGEGDNMPFRLQGIAGSNLGAYTPSILEMFTIPAGSVLQYRYSEGYNNSSTSGTFILTILSALVTDDSIYMTTEGVLYEDYNTTYPGSTPYERYCRTTGYIVVDTNRFEFRIRGPAGSGCGYTFNQRSKFHLPPYVPRFNNAGLADILHMIRPGIPFNERSTLSTSFASPLEAWDGDTYPNCTAYTSSTSSTMSDSGIINQVYLLDYDDEFEFAEELGLVNMRAYGIDYSGYVKLSAYRIGDESWGTFEDTTSWPLQIPSIQETAVLQATPNPTSGLLQLSGWTQPAIARIYNSTGQHLLNQLYQPGMPIDLSALPNGLYWIELQYKDQRGLARVSLIRP